MKRSSPWDWYLFALTTVYDLPFKVRARFRWWRRYGPRIRQWLKVYPWHVTVLRVQPWTIELGNHWRTEKLYLCMAKAGTNNSPPKFYYWKHLYVPNNS